MQYLFRTYSLGEGYSYGLCLVCISLEDTARYTGFLLAPAEGFGLWTRTFYSVFFWYFFIFSSNLSNFKKIQKKLKTRQGSPVDCRPSTAEAPPIGKIHHFSKMTVTFEPVMGF